VTGEEEFHKSQEKRSLKDHRRRGEEEGLVWFSGVDPFAWTPKWRGMRRRSPERWIEPPDPV
jgi:hypothetical protein